MSGIVALRAKFGRGAERIGNPLGRALVVRRKRDADMAIVEDGVIFAIGFRNLIQRLGNEVGADAVARHEGKRGLEEIQPAKCGKLVQHHQELMLAELGGIAFELFGQPAADLIENQPHERLGARNIRWRDDQIERNGPCCIDQIGNPPIASRRGRSNGGIAIKPEERHGRGKHAGAFVVGFVEDFASGGGDDGMDDGLFRRAQMVRRHHRAQRVLEGTQRIGQKARDAGERFFLLGIEDVKNRCRPASAWLVFSQ